MYLTCSIPSIIIQFTRAIAFYGRVKAQVAKRSQKHSLPKVRTKQNDKKGP